MAGGRRSRVVLTPRRWRQVGGRRLLPNRAFGGASFRRRWWQSSPVTRESTKETVKTIACGNAGCSGVSAVNTRVLSTFAHGAAGAAGTRRSPRPLIFRAGSLQNLGCIAPREGGRVSKIGCLKIESAPRANSLAPRAGRGLGGGGVSTRPDSRIGPLTRNSRSEFRSPRKRGEVNHIRCERA